MSARRLNCSDASLHGTWLPSTLTSRQRTLPKIPPDQDLLQEKLARSRIQAFVSIIFSRPTHREKSRFERFLLALMWPTAVLFLGLAIFEALRQSPSSFGLNKGLNQTIAGESLATAGKSRKAEVIGVGVSVFFGSAIVHVFSLLARDRTDR